MGVVLCILTSSSGSILVRIPSYSSYSSPYSLDFCDVFFLSYWRGGGISVLISSTGLFLGPFISLFITSISHFNVWSNLHFRSSTLRMTISVVEQILPFVSSHETVILYLLKGFLDFK